MGRGLTGGTPPVSTAYDFSDSPNPGLRRMVAIRRPTPPLAGGVGNVCALETGGEILPQAAIPVANSLRGRAPAETAAAGASTGSRAPGRGVIVHSDPEIDKGPYTDRPFYTIISRTPLQARVEVRGPYICSTPEPADDDEDRDHLPGRKIALPTLINQKFVC